MIGKHAYNNTVVFGGGVIRKTIGGDPFQLKVRLWRKELVS
jgi:hypothetical protein